MLIAFVFFGWGCSAKPAENPSEAGETTAGMVSQNTPGGAAASGGMPTSTKPSTAMQGGTEAAASSGGQAVETTPAPTGEVLAFRDLEYTPPEGGDPEMSKLDLFRVDDDVVRPLVLLVHGGSWASGDKAGFSDKIAPWWLEQGYVAAPVNFRLASKRRETPVVKPGDMAKDIAAALAWLMSKADEYKIAKDKVVLLGYSSGAHLVALLGTDERYLQNAGVDEENIAASISLDVHAYDVPYALSLMVGSVVEQNIPIIEHLFGATREEQLEASPIHYLDGWAARQLIISVDKDPEEEGTHGYIVSKTAQRYVEALRAAGHQAKTIHDSSETHASLVLGFGDAGDKATQAILQLIQSL